VEKVLLYSEDEMKAATIRRLCDELHISFMRLNRSDLGSMVISLVSPAIDPIKSKKTSVPALYAQPEIMIMSGFEDKKLDVYLAAYRSKAIEPVELKAVLTPYNCMWSVYELTQELEKENAAVKGRQL